MRDTAGSAAAPTARWRKFRRGSFILNLPLASHHSITSSARAPASFDQLVGAQEERFGDREAEYFGSRQVDDEIELGRLFDGDVARLRPTQNLVDIVGGAPEQVGEVWSIGHQT